MRYRLVAIAIVAAAALVASASAMTVLPGDGGGGGGTSPPPTAQDGAVFVLTGSGYGHGVGLSQYGARAQATAGRSAADILGFCRGLFWRQQLFDEIWSHQSLHLHRCLRFNLGRHDQGFRGIL